MKIVNKLNITKRNLYILVFSFIIMLFTVYLDSSFLSGQQISLAESLTIVLGLIFGPYAAVGLAFGEIISLLNIGEYSISFSILSGFLYFILAYTSYIVWYTCMTKDNVVYVPNLDNVYYYKKFIYTISLVSFLYFISTEIFYIDSMSIYILIRNICWTLETFVYALTGGMLIVILMNILNIPVVSMKKTKKVIIPPKIFTLDYILMLILGILGIFSSFVTLSITEDMYTTIMIVIIIMTLFYIFKPVTSEVKQDLTDMNININKKSKHKINLTLIEKGILISILLSYIVGMGIVIITLTGLLKTISFETKYFSALLYASITFILFYIINFIILSRLESNVTRPLEIISETSYNYITNNKKKDSEEIIKEYSQFNDYGIEISTLSQSISTMITDLEEYIKSIKEYTKEKEKINAELSVGRNIQQSFLPKNFDILKDKHINIYGSVTPSKEVAGDLYDFFIIDDDHVVILVGDVSGKGIPASLFMVKTMMLIKNIFNFKSDLVNNINYVNKQLCDNNDTNMFVTLWIGILNIKSGELNYINGGHNPIFIKRPKGKYEPLISDPDIALGIFEDYEYNKNTITLSNKDKLFLYTDGVTEANDINSNLYGEDKLIELLNKIDTPCTVEEIENKIKEDILLFEKGTEQFDDITIVSVEYNKEE